MICIAISKCISFLCRNIITTPSEVIMDYVDSDSNEFDNKNTEEVRYE